MGEMSAYGQQTPVKRRIAAFVLAIAVELLVATALLTIGQFSTEQPDKSTPLTVITLSGDHSKMKPTPTHPRSAVSKVAQAKSPPPPVPPTTVPKSTSPFIVFSRKDFAASDISKLPSHSTGATGASADAGGSTYGPGEGPGGARLYNAAWYVEPTPGELAYYLPQGAPPNSWATIACKTVEKYHVENCTALAESPPGSGLAKALRLASWQFLVRPPSRDGHPLIGSWVRIRFSWTEREVN